MLIKRCGYVYEKEKNIVRKLLHTRIVVFLEHYLPQNLLLNCLSIILDYFHRSLFIFHLPVGIFPVLSSLTLLTTIRNKTGNILNYQTKSIHILTTDKIDSL